MGLGAVVATATGVLTAYIFKFDKGRTDAGLYGFSAALVGIALTFMFESTIILWIIIIIFSALATLLQEWSIRKNFPAFTFPFIVMTWIAIAIAIVPHLGTAGITPDQASNWVGTHVLNTNDAMGVSAYGFGEVIFQGSIVAGALCFLGVFSGFIWSCSDGN